MLMKLNSHKNDKVEVQFKESLDFAAAFYDVKGYSPPKLVLLEDRETFNIAKGYETQDWMVGWYAARFVFMLSPDKFDTESSHPNSDEEIKRLLTHEAAHFFFNAFTGGDKPVWLNEGLSVYGKILPKNMWRKVLKKSMK